MLSLGAILGGAVNWLLGPALLQIPLGLFVLILSVVVAGVKRFDEAPLLARLAFFGASTITPSIASLIIVLFMYGLPGQDPDAAGGSADAYEGFMNSITAWSTHIAGGLIGLTIAVSVAIRMALRTRRMKARALKDQAHLTGPTAFNAQQGAQRPHQ